VSARANRLARAHEHRTRAKMRRMKHHGHCYLCGERIRGHGNGTLDHVEPKSRGGSNGIHNLRVCCIPCNLLKGSRTLDEFKAWLAKHPRATGTDKIRKTLGIRLEQPPTE